MLIGQEGTEEFSIPSSGISGNGLKLLAILTMLVDHIGAAVIEQGILRGYDPAELAWMLTTEKGAWWYQINYLCRRIGRISFPIFCFLLVEGFVHTRDVKKYVFRMFAFALISEIPFDLAFQGTLFDWGAQNVYFTLGIGLLVLWGMRRYSSQEGKGLAVAGAGCCAAYVMKTDYDAFGILLIVTLYLLRRRKTAMTLAGGALAVWESVLHLGSAALAFLPIWFYNGSRGRWRMKYLIYLFYPLHLVVLIVIRDYVLRL